MERVETPLERAARGQWEEPWRFELKMQAARFLTGNKGGQLGNARTEILPHQIFAAHRVVSSPRRRFLLADEVGLGKTIEAGMIWQALAQRGQAKRTLIITPAGLTTQWQEEMQDKFGATFEIFGRDFLAVNPRAWSYRAAAIASIDRLKRPEHKRILLENRKWDLIIFDEAHRLSAVDYASGKVEKTLNYRLAEEIRHQAIQRGVSAADRHAAPGRGEPQPLQEPGRAAGRRRRFQRAGGAGPVQPAAGGRKFTEFVIRTPKKDVTDADGRKVFKGRQTHRLLCKMYDDERRFYAAVTDYIRTGYQALERHGDATAAAGGGVPADDVSEAQRQFDGRHPRRPVVPAATTARSAARTAPGGGRARGERRALRGRGRGAGRRSAATRKWCRTRSPSSNGFWRRA